MAALSCILAKEGTACAHRARITHPRPDRSPPASSAASFPCTWGKPGPRGNWSRGSPSTQVPPGPDRPHRPPGSRCVCLNEHACARARVREHRGRCTHMRVHTRVSTRPRSTCMHTRGHARRATHGDGTRPHRPHCQQLGPLRCSQPWVEIQECFLEEAALESKWSPQAGLIWGPTGVLLVCCHVLLAGVEHEGQGTEGHVMEGV